MPNLPVLEPEAATEEVTAIYDDFQRRMGFPAPPNFIKTQGHSLAAAKGTWGLVQNVLIGGSLPRSLKELLFTAISRERRCRYCEAAHLACCRMLDVDVATTDQLLTDLDSVTPERTRDILRFGVKCARDPQSLVEADFETLRGHGLSQGEIMELISMAALAVYANTIADATAMESDDMFAQF